MRQVLLLGSSKVRMATVTHPVVGAWPGRKGHTVPMSAAAATFLAPTVRVLKQGQTMDHLL